MTQVLLGVTLPQFTDDADRFRLGVRKAEDLGFDSVWLFDHLWPLSGDKQRPILECWTALAWAIGATHRIRVGTLVTRASLRHPALLAKMAATVASVSPGRLTVALGSGDEANRAENEAFGIPYHDEEDRIAHLVETAKVLKAFWSEETVTVEGRFFSVRSLPSSPRPATPPFLWVGGRAGDTLDVAGRLADGWNGWGGTPARWAQDAGIVAQAADGRPLELSWAGQVLLGRDDDDARVRLGDRNPRAFVTGGPETVAARLRSFVDSGASHLIVAFPRAGADDSYELLAERVRPLLGC